MEYKKILIFGLTASGKTTLAKDISKILKIKVFHTDDFAYKKKWTIKSNKKEFMDKLNRVVNKKEWIIEGVHSEWVLNAVKKADLVIFLNISKFVMAKRALKRYRINKKSKDSFKQKLKLLYWIYRWGPKWYTKYKKDSKKFIEIKNNEDVLNLLKMLNIVKKVEKN